MKWDLDLGLTLKLHGPSLSLILSICISMLPAKTTHYHKGTKINKIGHLVRSSEQINFFRCQGLLQYSEFCEMLTAYDKDSVGRTDLHIHSRPTKLYFFSKDRKRWKVETNCLNYVGLV